MSPVPLLGVLILLLALPAAAEDKSITAAEARNHVKQQVTVCGKVVAVEQRVSRNGRRWLLRIDQAAPPVFTILLGGETIGNPVFSDADRRYADKDICVTGLVRDYNGMIHMQPNAPGQIRIVKPAGS